MLMIKAGVPSMKDEDKGNMESYVIMHIARGEGKFPISIGTFPHDLCS